MSLYGTDDKAGREEQQDHWEALENRYSKFLILGDGMGGHKGGAFASKTLVRRATEYYRKYGNSQIDYPDTFFQEIVDATTRDINQFISENPSTDPHTTCVLALVQDGKLYTGHIGDSRMYLFLDEMFTRRSKDHSVVQMLVNDGEISEEEMATHPDQNKLLKSIGGHKNVKITYKVDDFPKNTKNAVLICSDGFWEQISPDVMERGLFHEATLKSVIDEMVSVARYNGGSDCDNISVVAYVQEKKMDIFSDKLLMSLFAGLLTVAIFALGYWKKDYILKFFDDNKTVVTLESNDNNVINVDINKDKTNIEPNDNSVDNIKDVEDIDQDNLDENQIGIESNDSNVDKDINIKDTSHLNQVQPITQTNQKLIKQIANYVGKNIMSDIGGGKNLNVNIKDSSYNRNNDTYTIKIGVTFDGLYLGSYYNTEGTITCKSNGDNFNYESTYENDNYKKVKRNMNALDLKDLLHNEFSNIEKKPGKLNTKIKKEFYIQAANDKDKGLENKIKKAGHRTRYYNKNLLVGPFNDTKGNKKRMKVEIEKITTKKAIIFKGDITK